MARFGPKSLVPNVTDARMNIVYATDHSDFGIDLNQG
jgi:hypothetical protein